MNITEENPLGSSFRLLDVTVQSIGEENRGSLVSGLPVVMVVVLYLQAGNPLFTGV